MPARPGAYLAGACTIYVICGGAPPSNKRRVTIHMGRNGACQHGYTLGRAQYSWGCRRLTYAACHNSNGVTGQASMATPGRAQSMLWCRRLTGGVSRDTGAATGRASIAVPRGVHNLGRWRRLTRGVSRFNWRVTGRASVSDLGRAHVWGLLPNTRGGPLIKVSCISAFARFVFQY